MGKNITVPTTTNVLTEEEIVDQSQSQAALELAAAGATDVVASDDVVAGDDNSTPENTGGTKLTLVPNPTDDEKTGGDNNNGDEIVTTELEEEVEEEKPFVRLSAMSKSNKYPTLKSLFRQYKKGELRFDLAIQRRKVWKEDPKKSEIHNQKSLLIHSAMYGFPIPQVFVINKGDKNYWFLDGQQRTTTLMEYMDDKFAMLIGTPDVFDHEVEGKKFSQLPKEIQETIEETTLHMVVLEDATSEEIEEMFYRLNNGTALNRIEKLRAMLGEVLMNQVQELAAHPFFKTIPLTDNQRNGFMDEELILQALSVEFESNIGFTTEELTTFGISVKEIGLDKSVSDNVGKVSDFLNNAFREVDEKIKKKFLKKNNITPIYGIGKIAANRTDITPAEFAEFVVSFFKKPPFEYKNTSSNGTASKDNVKKRMQYIRESFIASFNKA